METQFSFVRFSRSANAKPWLLTSVLITILALMLLSLAMAPAHAKAPGSKYCFHGKCHRVKTIGETNALVGKSITLHASHYDACGRDRYNPCGLTSSGERFHPERPDNAASPIYPDGTILLIWNEATGSSVVVRINNAGPYWGNRKLDVSYAAAQKLGFKNRGVAKLRTMIIGAPTKSQARYRRHRSYRRVPGFVGQFSSLEEAHRATVAIMAVEALAGSTSGLALGGVVSASRFETNAVSKQRAVVAQQEAEFKLAMNGSRTIWPDFAVAAATPERVVAAVRTGVVTASRALEVPQVQQANLGRSGFADGQAADVPTGVIRTALLEPSVANGEWLTPARPAVDLIRATDPGTLNAQLWLERGRLGFLFKLSKLEPSGRLETSSVSRPRAFDRVASRFQVPGERHAPDPVRRPATARKVASHVGRLT